MGENTGETEAWEPEDETGEVDDGTIICYGLFPENLETKPSAERGIVGSMTTSCSTPAPGTLNAVEKAETSDDGKWIKIRSYVDSGAARSLCPRNHADQFQMVDSADSRKGAGFLTICLQAPPGAI